MAFNPENLVSQYAFLLAIIFANAYADGLIMRSLILPLTTAINAVFRESRLNKAFYIPRFPNWKHWQWIWHILKWVYFNVVLGYIVIYFWKWPAVLVISGAIVGLVFWQVIYRWDFLYGKELEP